MKATTNMKHLLSAFTLFVLFFAVSCSDETEDLNLEQGTDFFPMESGFWVTYKVDSFIHTRFAEGGIDTVSVELREVLGDEFIDNEGRAAITVERYVRNDENTDWEDVIPTIWYAVRTDKQAERMEGERRFLKLVFPMWDNRKWNGNAFLNTDGDPDLAAYANWQYKFTNIGEQANVGGMSFDNTATVIQNDYEDLVDKIYSEEVYAKNVGLISKREWLLNLGQNDIDPSVPWPERAELGTRVELTITDYKQ